MTWLGSVHALNTSSRGASKTRVIVSSCVADGLVAAMTVIGDSSFESLGQAPFAARMARNAEPHGNVPGRRRRAVLAPNLPRLLRHAAIGRQVLLRHGHDKSIDIGHVNLHLICRRQWRRWLEA